MFMEKFISQNSEHDQIFVLFIYFWFPAILHSFALISHNHTKPCKITRNQKKVNNTKIWFSWFCGIFFDLLWSYPIVAQWHNKSWGRTRGENLSITEEIRAYFHLLSTVFSQKAFYSKISFTWLHKKGPPIGDLIGDLTFYGRNCMLMIDNMHSLLWIWVV